MTLKLRGSMVALVTPFKNGRVDEAALKRLVEFHIANGTSVLVPCGTTGESATLSVDEHARVIELVIQASRGRVPVMPGTGSNNTEEAIALTRHAKRAGADAALLISPYYNRPSQRGLYLHFKAIAEAVDLPLVVYNIASRTAVNIEPETFAKLAELPNIVGVKESSGSLEQMSRIQVLTKRRLALISGDDSLTLPVLAIGGVGVISVVANLVPQDVAALVRAFEQGNIRQAIDLHERLLPLVKAMFVETNPVPVKTAMGLLGMIEPSVRLPLCELEPASREKVQAALAAYGLKPGVLDRAGERPASASRTRAPKKARA